MAARDDHFAERYVVWHANPRPRVERAAALRRGGRALFSAWELRGTFGDAVPDAALVWLEADDSLTPAVPDA